MNAMTKLSRLFQALLETANVMRRVGALLPAPRAKVMLLHYAPSVVAPKQWLGNKAVSRSGAAASGGVRTVFKADGGYVSQQEPGGNQVTGPVLGLLDVMRRRGLREFSNVGRKSRLQTQFPALFLEKHPLFL
jgi:hypothetical protein